MITTGRVLLGSAMFALVVGSLYWFLSYESAGSLMLLTMTAGLGIGAGYLSLARRRAPMPADQKDVRPSDARGEDVGVFASHSAWPAVLALGCAVGLTGLIYGWWLVVVGAGGVTLALIGLFRDDRATRSR
ncbi:MAG TPA: cytochrome c oxidase subunit 4 [bacterium]|nr:cytochrome c oxidase subunit 4 [bacterium]